MDERTKRFLMDYTLGGVAGAISKTLTAPFHRIKVVLQNEKLDRKIRRGEEPEYSGIIDCANRIYRKQGILAFWDGNLMGCFRYFPTQGFNLAMKDTFKRMFPKYSPKTDFIKFFLANLASGGLAAAGSLLVAYPWDHVTFCLNSDTSRRFQGPSDVVKKTYSKCGLRAFYTGIGVSVVGIVAYRALQLGFFDTLTGLNPWRAEKGLLGAWSNFIAAQVAINIGAALTFPFDTVRRRLQMDQILKIGDDEEQEYDGAIDCFKKIAAEEGLAGFYRGYWVNFLASVASTSTLMAYGRAKKICGF